MADNQMTATRTCRLLYYGAGSTGKRENLRRIHGSIPPEQKLSLASNDPERQIAFTVNYGNQEKWQVLVQSVDAGRERYHTAGMPNHPPFDGIVFVVDSTSDNLDRSLSAFEALKTYLDSWGLDLMSIPMVIQYNGRDMDNVLAVDRLESLLNPWGLLSFPASARLGEGVKETLKAILGLTVNSLEQGGLSHLGMERGKVDIHESGFGDPVTGPQEETESIMEGIEYGIPLPGEEDPGSTRSLSEAIYEELRPPVVIPVKIPKRLLDGGGPVRILLEVEIDEDSRI